MFHIEVEAIYRNVLKWTGKDVLDIAVEQTDIVPSFGLAGTKGIPQEVGKPFGNFIHERNGMGTVTSNRQENLLPKGLTDRNILPDLVASREQA